MASSVPTLLGRYAALFWDFDGVIKESVDVKTQAYVGLFQAFGPAVAARVREHHERHGGMSRFAKIPLYLEWAQVTPTRAETARYCELFSASVLRNTHEQIAGHADVRRGSRLVDPIIVIFDQVVRSFDSAALGSG